MKTCPQCGWLLLDNAEMCEKCNYVFKMKKRFCGKCGASLYRPYSNKPVRYCMVCGAPVENGDNSR